MKIQVLSVVFLLIFCVMAHIEYRDGEGVFWSFVLGFSKALIAQVFLVLLVLIIAAAAGEFS